MKESDPVSKPSMNLLMATSISIGLALVSSWLLAILASSLGILFTGLDTFFAVLIATVFCSVVTVITAWGFKRKGKAFAIRTIFVEVVPVALVAVSLLSWLQTRQTLKIFMNPLPVPSGVHIHHGRTTFFGGFVHFSAPPSTIAAIIKSKELVEVPAEMPDHGDIDVSGYSFRQSTKVPWDWWQPTSMSNPRFYYRHHSSKAVQGWTEGWWVNDATNEIYALIGG